MITLKPKLWGRGDAPPTLIRKLCSCVVPCLALSLLRVWILPLVRDLSSCGVLPKASKRRRALLTQVGPVNNGLCLNELCIQVQ